ncbi:sperm motility kinase 4A-like [Perognathus longimembris pacificus]|uniref:sperm motility kinase 4A-like n=1 Tax=Perognathus longimembris pacificus TaxID=214514 RepID=UPI002018A9DA|nr:sperm motility kinase 4A-like [Perognathus longimembris pacificus]
MIRKSRQVRFLWDPQVISTTKELRGAHYEVLRTIARGAFAPIKLARHLLTDSLVAVKILNKIDSEFFMTEVDILKSVEHQNIVKLFEVVETEERMYLVMEYLDGDLADYVQMVGRMEEELARPIFWQILGGVKYCHDHCIAHRDLKAENVLLNSRGIAKISDFGLSTRFLPRQELQRVCGTMTYWPPEIFKHQKYQGPKMDVWSLGVLLYYIVMGELPFKGRSWVVLKEQVPAGIFKIRKGLSPEFLGVLSYMMTANPKLRPSVWQVMSHSWFGEIEEEPPSLIETVEKQPDPTILQLMNSYLGIPPEEVQAALSGRIFNAASATFKILQDQQEQGQELTCLVRHPLPGPPPCPSPVDSSCRNLPFKRASAPVRHPAAGLPDEQQEEEGGRKGTRSVCLPYILWSPSTSVTDGKTEGSQSTPAPAAAAKSIPTGQPRELTCPAPEKQQQMGKRAGSLPNILYNLWTWNTEGERDISSAAPHLEPSVQECKDPGETEERSEIASETTVAETPSRGTEAVMGLRGRLWKRLKKVAKRCRKMCCCCLPGREL